MNAPVTHAALDPAKIVSDDMIDAMESKADFIGEIETGGPALAPAAILGEPSPAHIPDGSDEAAGPAIADPAMAAPHPEFAGSLSAGAAPPVERGKRAGAGTGPAGHTGEMPSWNDDLLRRPPGYHPVLPWPPARLVDRVAKAGRDEATRQKLREEIERHCAFLRRRLEEIDRSFKESRADRKSLPKRVRNRLRENGHDEEAINAAETTMIASLFLNPQGATSNFAQNAHFISRNRVRTFDGAKLSYSEKGVKLNRMTEQGIALLIEEARARNWKSIEVRGPAAFRKAVIQAARAAAMDIPVHERGLFVNRTHWARKPTHVPLPRGAEEPGVPAPVRSGDEGAGLATGPGKDTVDPVASRKLQPGEPGKTVTPRDENPGRTGPGGTEAPSDAPSPSP